MSHKHSIEKTNVSIKKNSVIQKSLNEISMEIPDKKKIKFDLFSKKWKVFRVSPVYNLSKNTLKFLEKRLDEEMNSKINKTNTLFKSKFSLNKIILTLNNQCFEGLQVELFKNESQSAYVGLFISWSGMKISVEDAVSLPILLVEANAHDLHKVHSSLCKIFDCDIQPVMFSFYALVFFFVKMLETERCAIDVSQEQVTMEFRVPGCKVNDKIKISLNLQDIIVVFAVVMDDLNEKSNEINTMDIIWEFYNKILNHIYQIFRMDLMYAELQNITFPEAFLTTDGQLRISTDNAAISCLNVLKCFTPLDAVITL